MSKSIKRMDGIQHKIYGLLLSAHNTFYLFYRPHPKDGEGNIFSLSTTGGGRYQVTGPRSFLGGYPSPGQRVVPQSWPQGTPGWVLPGA